MSVAAPPVFGGESVRSAGGPSALQRFREWSPAVVASPDFMRMKAEIFSLLREEALAAQRQEEAR